MGHLDLQSRAIPIDQLLEGKSLPPKLRGLLGQVAQIRSFAANNGLNMSDNYASYSELDRDAAVWVVTASAPLAFEPVTWSFPPFGSFPYLAWYDQGDAQRFADGMAQRGLDVHVRGAAAYSTLGWFADPILSTMLTRGASVTGDFVNTILHESVHATVYVDGQGYFNESLALFVADRMTPLYLRKTFGDNSAQVRAYGEQQQRRAVTDELALTAYQRLEAVYGSDLSDIEKLAAKHTILTELEDAIGATGEINNASLEGFRTYRVGLDSFAALFEHCGGKWERFLAATRQIRPDYFASEQQEDLRPVFARLLERSCD